MWEQTAVQPGQIKRRSLPPNQQTRIAQRQGTPPAPPHRAGHNAGLHPEDQPYVTMQQQRPQQPLTYDTEDDDAIYPQRQPSSAIRYVDTQGNQVIQQGKKRIVIHNEPPSKRNIHWSLLFGIGMLLMLGLVVGGIWLANWWTNHQLDATYGMPRTYQIDAVVGHEDSAASPSHFLFLNLNGHVEVIELPGGDGSKAKIYIGPTLFTDNAALVPVTGEFKAVNGTVEML